MTLVRGASPQFVTTSTSVATRRATWPYSATILGALMGAVLAQLTRNGIADDGYITLAMARNVAAHGCWCVTPGLTSNTATSPLWVVLLALPMLLVGPVVALGMWLTALTASTSLVVAALAQRCGWAWWAGPLAAAGLVTSPVMQAAAGLESALAVFLIAALAWCAAEGRPGRSGLVIGLLVLTRPDLAAVGMVALLWWWRRTPTVAMAAAAVVIPWLVVSWGLFGSLVPDTLIWKQDTSGLGGTTLPTAGGLFLSHWPAATLLAIATLAAGAVAGTGWVTRFPRGPVTLLAVGGAVHLTTMIALGVGPFVWYLGPSTGVAVLLVALAAARAPRWAWATPTSLVLVGATLTASHDWSSQGAPFHANGALTDQYAAVAARVPTGSTVETAHGEVGAIAFFCNERCRVVDPLSDPGRMSPLIERRLGESSMLRALYPGWRPRPPASAEWRTRYADHGVATFSGYGGRGHIAVEPLRPGR